MPDQVPPPWEGDPLSKYFADAEHNTRASAVNWPDVYEVQQGAHALLRRLLDAIENERGDSRDVGSQRMLIHRSHGAILATMRLTMSGQAIEAMPVLRLAIEEAWYALHIAKDPAPPTRARIWWNRDDSPQATQACREEFSAGNVRRTHEGLDPRTAALDEAALRRHDHLRGPPQFERGCLGVNALREHAAKVFQERARALRQERADSARPRPD
jgi:hypothetical protein